MLQTKKRLIRQYLNDRQANGALSVFDCLLSDSIDHTLQKELRQLGLKRIGIHIDWLSDYQCIDIQGKHGKMFVELQIEPGHFTIGCDPDEPEEYTAYPLTTKEHLYSVIEKTIRCDGE